MSPARLILEQTTRIAQMTRRISDFASARDGRAEWVDVNAMLRAVCDFLVFDSRLRGIRIEFVPAAGLPAHELVPDHLNEVMMNLLLTCAQVSAPKTIFVETLARGATIVIQVDCRRLDDSATPLPHDDTRLEPIRRRVAEMGGSLTVADGRVEIVLPPAAAGTG
jgi:nitrogen-specific signal transduction histidine kinase